MGRRVGILGEGVGLERSRRNLLVPSFLIPFRQRNWLRKSILDGCNNLILISRANLDAMIMKIISR